VCSSDLLVPPSLRRYAGLEHEVVIQGLSSKFEIWSRAKWEGEMESSAGDLEKTAQYLAETGLQL
jgi:MraZ protein